MKNKELKEYLIKSINTYSMMHKALKDKGINDIHYYKQMIKALNELKELNNKQLVDTTVSKVA